MASVQSTHHSPITPLRPMDWDPDFLARSPMLAPLRICAPEWPAGRWPDPGELQALLERRDPPICVSSGAPLRIVPQLPGVKRPDVSYEERVYRHGELQIRPENWHDLLNFLVWFAFPRAKAALNARHYAAYRRRVSAGAGNRGPIEDALTLFDEGGVIIAAVSDELLAHLHAYEWKALFWNRRREVVESMRFWLFGHALYEKALRPFVGITGRGICFGIGENFLRAPLADQLSELDGRLADHIGAPDRLTATRDLAVVPILGVPGWCAENEAESYYDNAGYFRPHPRRRSPFIAD